MFVQSNFPPMLYKYCDVETFFNIINSQKLWLTTNSNDDEEFLIVENLIKAYRKSNHIDFKLDALFKNHSLRSKPFMTCFSEDNDDVAMWERYAENSKGFSIAISPASFGIAPHFPFLHPIKELSIGFKKVIYSDQDQKILFEETLKKRRIDDVEFIAQLQCLSYIFKKQNWKSENEWRIIYLPGLENKMLAQALKEVLFYKPLNANLTSTAISGSSKNFEYCELDLHLKNNSFAISEIIIGRFSDYSIEKIEGDLQKLGITGVKIKKSTSSLKKV